MHLVNESIQYNNYVQYNENSCANKDEKRTYSCGQIAEHMYRLGCFSLG
jgi:hypothetical protein